MVIEPDQLAPLLPSARVELARQINAGVGDAARLVAESGWSWNLAFVLVRAIHGEGANAAALHHEGIPAQAARVIADAIAARPPAPPQPIAVETRHGAAQNTAI